MAPTSGVETAPKGDLTAPTIGVETAPQGDLTALTELEKIAALAETASARYEELREAFQNLDQRQNDLMNQMAAILKAIREMAAAGLAATTGSAGRPG